LVQSHAAKRHVPEGQLRFRYQAVLEHGSQSSESRKIYVYSEA
jgi:hypothetical protein